MNSKKRRPIIGLFIRPNSQLRYALGGVALIVFAIIAMALVLANSIVTSLDLLSSAGQFDEAAAELIKRSLYYGIAGISVMTVCLGIYSFWAVIRFTHRVYGPVVPILRAINEFNNGNFDARIQLRKSDELNEVAEALNNLAKNLRYFRVRSKSVGIENNNGNLE